jgi:hypothetical protein
LLLRRGRRTFVTRRRYVFRTLIDLHGRRFALRRADFARRTSAFL